MLAIRGANSLVDTESFADIPDPEPGLGTGATGTGGSPLGSVPIRTVLRFGLGAGEPGVASLADRGGDVEPSDDPGGRGSGFRAGGIEGSGFTLQRESQKMDSC